jgi:hypothetical protein
LEKAKRAHLPFDVAWERSWRRVKWPHDTEHRRAWKKALAATRPSWECAYDDTLSPVNDAVGVMELAGVA